MLIIRFTRIGRKHDPYFRLVVVDSRKALRSGDYLENLGSYNPRGEDQKFDGERVKYWISKGAQVSDSAFNALVDAKILSGKKRKITSAERKKPSEEGKAVEENGNGGEDKIVQNSGIPENEITEDAPAEEQEKAGTE
ncbi:MAG: 30S ribosomal protein S16 [Candidatus Pacebacteria bacterium]|nr:30S ribosomal protein S16 [Candidatus Paceibacterota bacterium]